MHPSTQSFRSHFGSSSLQLLRKQPGLLTMAACKRPRSVANPAVGMDKYKEMFESWLLDNVGTLPQLLGPCLVTDLRGVLPHHVIRLSGLLDRFFTAGLTNAVILPSKLEIGIRSVLAENPERAARSTGLDLYAHQITEHIKHSFSMLRIIKLETNRSSLAGVSKSSAFRRKASASESIVINNLVAKVILEAFESGAGFAKAESATIKDCSGRSNVSSNPNAN